MSDTANIHLAGVQINFKSWSLFNLELLSSDGVVFFQYLAYHCQNVIEWTHSDKNLEHELGIGRRRLEALRKLFIEKGFLQTYITRDSNDNRIRAYRINYMELAKSNVLKQIYREQDDKGQPVNFATYIQIYQQIAASQPKAGTTKRERQIETIRANRVRTLAERLEILFDNRREVYIKKIREKKATGETSLREPVGSIKFAPRHIKNLTNALKNIQDEEFIYNAFMVYCDLLNAHQNSPTAQERLLLPQTPRDPLAYFLSYSTGINSSSSDMSDGQGYQTIHMCGNYHGAHYGRNA